MCIGNHQHFIAKVPALNWLLAIDSYVLVFVVVVVGVLCILVDSTRIFSQLFAVAIGFLYVLLRVTCILHEKIWIHYH